MAVIFFPQEVYKGQAITNTERATLGLMGLAQSYISCKLAIRPLGLLYFTGPLFKKCIVKMMYLYQKMITLGTRMMSSNHLPLYFTFTKFMDKNSWFVKYKLQKGSLKLSVQVPKAASFISY